MMRTMSLVTLFARVSIQNFAAYRFDFIVRFFVSAAHVAYELIVVWTVNENTKSLQGWGWQHLLVLLGVYRMIAGGIRMSIVPNMQRLLTDIREGTLDFVLMRPVDAQLMVSVREFVIWRISDLLLGLGMALYGCYKLTHQIPLASALQFAVMIAAALTIVYCVWLMLATLCFWFVRIQNIEMIFWNVFEAGRFPIAIYNPSIRWVLTFILPLAFITTFPAGTLMGDPNTGVPDHAPIYAVLLATALIVVSRWFWRFGLRHYSGASA